LQVRTLSTLLCSLIAAGCFATDATAAGTGGVPAGEKAPAPAVSKPKIHLFPITARSRSLAYRGPVYVKTATGQIIPFTPGAATTTPAAALTDATGGAAPANAASGTPMPEGLSSGSGMTSAGGPAVRPQLLVPGTTARFVDGLAAAPMAAPAAVQEIVWAGNEIIGLPYIYGGGHGSWISHGYDCSGTVSFALHGASLLTLPEDSSEFEVWGSHGAGRWVTIFSNPGHAYMTVAGLRLDTSSADDPSNQQGPRWRPLRVANYGYRVRHPLGL
jgi:cell wall-associated NlpC family hydrolase